MLRATFIYHPPTLLGPARSMGSFAQTFDSHTFSTLDLRPGGDGPELPRQHIGRAEAGTSEATISNSNQFGWEQPPKLFVPADIEIPTRSSKGQPLPVLRFIASSGCVRVWELGGPFNEVGQLVTTSAPHMLLVLIQVADPPQNSGMMVLYMYR